MTEVFTVLANVPVLAFVVSSMLAMGLLSLRVKQIVDPLPLSCMPLGGEAGMRQAAMAPAGVATESENS